MLNHKRSVHFETVGVGEKAPIETKGRHSQDETPYGRNTQNACRIN